MSFERIGNSIFVDFYINEIWAVATSISALENRLKDCGTFEEMRKNEGRNMISPSVEPHELASSILSSTSRLHKLFESSNQRAKESDSDYSFRKARSNFLRKTLLPKKKSGYEIFKSRVRNAIEHFDERIDLLNNKILAGDTTINTKAILYNMTVSSKTAFDNWNDLVPIKVLSFDNGDYYMVDHTFSERSVNLYEIFNEVRYIQEKCVVWGEGKIDSKGNHLQNPVGIIKTAKHSV